MKRFLLLIVFSLAACSTMNNAAVTPTVVAQTPAPESPVVSPSVTPTIAVEKTPTPRPTPVTMEDLGITNPNSDLSKAFKGIEKTVTMEADGTFSVKANTYEDTKIVQRKYILELNTFNANTDIKDALTRPLEVKAIKLDKDGKKIGEVILLWQKETGGWHEEFDISKSDDPTFSKINEHIYFDRADILTLLQSARAYFRDHPPFSQAAFDNFMKTQQNELFLEYEGGGKIASIRSASNNIGGHTPETATAKFLTIWVKTKNSKGEIIDAPLIGIIDPSDLKNITPDDYKIFVDTGDNVDGEGGIRLSERNQAELKEFAKQYYGPNQNPPSPQLTIYADELKQKKDPLLAKIFLEINKDPAYLDKLGVWGFNIRGFFGMSPNNPPPFLLDTNNPVIALNFKGIPIPPELQTRFLFIRIVTVRP